MGNKVTVQVKKSDRNQLTKPDAVKQMEIGSMQLMLQWLHEDASLTSSAHPADSTIIP